MRKRFHLLLSMITVLVVFLGFAATASAKDDLKNTDPDKYYILLDLRNQVVTVYEKDENGEYTRIVRQFICSTGKTTSSHDDDGDGTNESTPTPTGVWKIGGRERFGKFAKFSEYARYWTQLVQDIYFHSVMFKKADVTTIMKNPYHSLGNDVSHGCVRLLVEDAKWLYYYACPGTTVKVTKSGRTNRELKNALKKSRNLYPFSEYSALQANFFDNAEQENDKAWVTHENAAIRKESKASAKNIRSLSVGDELEILLYNDAWVKVRDQNGKEGYVFRGYISLEKGKTDTVPDASLIRATTWMWDNESTDTDHRICKVPTDTTVKVLETNEETGYTKIQYYTEVGYVKTKSLRTGWGIDRQSEPAAGSETSDQEESAA